MASIPRLLIWALFLLGSPVFLILQGSLTPITRIAGATTILSLMSILLFTGKPKQQIVAPISRYQADPAPVSSLAESSSMTYNTTEETITSKTPIENKSNETDEPTVKEQPSQGESKASDSPRVAEKYAVSSDAQTEFEDEVELFVETRRERRSEIRDKIERDRRKALAPMRTRRLREWADREDGEGLDELVKNTHHGLKILNYDYSSISNGIIGSTFVRLDDQRILKVNREIPFEHNNMNNEDSVVEISEASEDSDTEPDPPPPPPPSGLPPPPPPIS